MQVYFQFSRGRPRRIEFLTPAQVADLLHVEVRTVYSWIERRAADGIPFHRITGGRTILFDLGEVVEWISKNAAIE